MLATFDVEAVDFGVEVDVEAGWFEFFGEQISHFGRAVTQAAQKLTEAIGGTSQPLES